MAIDAETVKKPLRASTAAMPFPFVAFNVPEYRFNGLMIGPIGLSKPLTMSRNSLILTFVSFAIIVGSACYVSRYRIHVSTTESPLGEQGVAADRMVEANSKAIDTSKLLCEIPFVLIDGNSISIRAMINNIDKMRLMFHTANNGVVITKDASKRATSLKFDKSADINSWGGKSEGRISDNNSLTIGSMSWDSLRIFQDLHSGPETDGKFGPDLFEDYVIEIDFDSSILKIYSGLPSLSDKFERINLEQKNGMMFVTCAVKVGEKSLENKFLIHSGFGGSVLLDDAFAQANVIGHLKTLSESELRDSGGKVLKTQKVELPELKIGSFEFTNVPTQIFDGSIRKQKISIIGGDLLKRFNIIFDRRDSCVYLRRNHLFASPFSE